MAAPKTKKLACSILNIEPDPVHPGRTIVSVRFDDGDKELGPWNQAFSLLPERPISLEEFIHSLKDREIVRPVDPFQYLKEATGKDFELELPANS